MNKNIILISGLKNSGKDTVGKYFIDRGYEQLSFADKLKDAVSILFDFDRHMLNGIEADDRFNREVTNQWWTDQLGFELSPRKALELVGTDLFREHFHPDFWVLSTVNNMYAYHNYIITDVRFPNEIERMKEFFPNQVITINIERSPLPFWYRRNYNFITKFLAKTIAKFQDVHKCEYSLLGYEFDYTIINDGTIEELYSKVGEIYEHIKAQTLFLD